MWLEGKSLLKEGWINRITKDSFSFGRLWLGQGRSGTDDWSGHACMRRWVCWRYMRKGHQRSEDEGGTRPQWTKLQEDWRGGGVLLANSGS